MIERGNKGALAEHLAVAFLLRQGFEVYRNVSPHGAIDLIAIRGAETLRLDVKTRRGGTLYRVTQRQRELGVKLALVDPRTGECAVADPAAPLRRSLKCAACDRLFQPRIDRQVYCHRLCAARARYAARHKKAGAR